MNKKELLIAAKQMSEKLQDRKQKQNTSITTQTEDGHKYDKLLKRIQSLEELLEDAEERLYKNEKDINQLNQYTRRENIEIVGIPASIKQVDLEATVIDILKNIGVTCSSYDIAACHRLNNKKDKDTSKNTIVRFVCRKKVFEIMANKKKLSTVEVIEKHGGNEYYICENLSPMNKKIIDTCHYLKKKNLIKSCWSFNGAINFKFSERDNEIPKKLYHFEDIFYYIPKAENFI